MTRRRSAALFGAALLAAFALGQDQGRSNPSADKEPAPSHQEAKFRVVTLRGKVVSYRKALEERLGVKLVESKSEGSLCLATEDGAVLPLWPSDAAQFFYDDPRNLGRSVQITGRQYPDAPGLFALDVRSIKDGVLHEIYYWCDICSIKMFRWQQCECCQGPIELREHPVGEPFRSVETKGPPR